MFLPVYGKNKMPDADRAFYCCCKCTQEGEKNKWIGKNGISGERIKEAIGEIERYRKDMITEHCTGYEADIEACTSLIEELSEWYGQVEGQRKNTGEIEALEGDKMEEGSTGEA